MPGARASRRVTPAASRPRYMRALADPRVLRYLGLALAGEHRAAIAALEPVAGSSTGAEGWEVLYPLADSYVRAGQKEAARRVLDAARQDPEVGESALGLLRQFDAGEDPFFARPD